MADTCCPEEQCGETTIRSWLTALDDGRGELIQYLGAITDDFDNLRQLSCVWCGCRCGDSIVHGVDPIFWEVVRVTKLGHKVILARGIQSLGLAFP